MSCTVIRAEAYGIETYNKSCTSLTTESTTVAVKMLRERADLNQRKALLAELKILIHVGKHINIVNLLGAVTQDLIKGQLLVIVEYCRFGNIRSFLLDHRKNFVNQLDTECGEINAEINGETEPKYYNINENTSIDYQNTISISGMIFIHDNLYLMTFLLACSLSEIPHIKSRKVTTCDLISYVFQCAKGMEYLSSRRVCNF